MRISGAFTVGTTGSAVPIGLPPGGVFYYPPGNYWISLGSQTVTQFFDPVNAIWRNVGFPGGIASAVSVDGYNNRLVNLSGCIVGASITNAGSGGTNGIGATATSATVSFGSAPTNGIVCSAYPIVGGKITALTLVAGGSGFVMPPLILIDPPPAGGIQATATATISGGAITAVTIQNPGAGYIAGSTPLVYVVPQFATYVGIGQPVNTTAPTNVIPPGTVASVITPPFLPGLNFAAGQPTAGGASITSTVGGSGTLTGIVMTNYGSNYTGTQIPTITITGGGLTGALATAIGSFCITAMPNASATGGTGYTVGAPWESSLGLVAATDGCNGEFQIRSARGTIASTTGFSGTNAVIEDPGFGLQKVPNLSILPFTAVPGSISTLVPTVGGQFDVSYMQPAIED